MSLSADIEAFLVSRIESVERLEALLLLSENGSSPLTATKVGESIGIEEEAAERALHSLQEDGLLEFDGTAFRYAPADRDVSRIVEDLGREYRNRRTEVINAIYSGNLDRLRRFADAFRLRKK